MPALGPKLFQMKSHISVLIDPSTRDIDARLQKVLEPHRLDEDSSRSIHAHHWDYWYFPSEATFDDQELKRNYPAASGEVLNHACYVRNLPENYTTSGVICLDGSWIDLQDFGWRMADEPSAANRKAMEKWMVKWHRIRFENNDQICVQVITHC